MINLSTSAHSSLLLCIVCEWSRIPNSSLNSSWFSLRYFTDPNLDLVLLSLSWPRASARHFLRGLGFVELVIRDGNVACVHYRHINIQETTFRNFESKRKCRSHWHFLGETFFWMGIYFDEISLGCWKGEEEYESESYPESLRHHHFHCLKFTDITTELGTHTTHTDGTWYTQGCGW